MNGELPESLVNRMLEEIHADARPRATNLVRFYLNEEGKDQLRQSFGLSDLHSTE
jgi:hypothetical protein